MLLLTWWMQLSTKWIISLLYTIITSHSLRQRAIICVNINDTHFCSISNERCMPNVSAFMHHRVRQWANGSLTQVDCRMNRLKATTHFSNSLFYNAL